MKDHALVVHKNGKVKGKFKGKCYHCGKKGNRTVDCPLKKKEVLPKSNCGGRNSGNLNGLCHNCGKGGHTKYKCWELQKNLDNRTRNWKGTAESSNVATNNQTGQSHAEFMHTKMLNKVLPDSTRFLLDTHIMIADTGETCDTTLQKKGFVNSKDSTE